MKSTRRCFFSGATRQYVKYFGGQLTKMHKKLLFLYQAEAQKTYVTETLEPAMEMMQKMLESNKGGDGFFVHNEVSLYNAVQY